MFQFFSVLPSFVHAKAKLFTMEKDGGGREKESSKKEIKEGKVLR